MYFKRWKIFTAQPLNRLKYIDPIGISYNSNEFFFGNDFVKKKFLSPHKLDKFRHSHQGRYVYDF